MTKRKIKETVKERYSKIVSEGSSCCGPSSSCCGSVDFAQDISKNIGYSDEELKSVPEGSNLGLGCGNPVALASLREGEIVLDLGSGAGLDCFLASQKVGEKGKVIGVDMTPEMVKKARENAIKGGYRNIEFRLGEIENLPVPDNSVDVVISNCVINLSPDKDKVFSEAFRVLKPGGRLMVSDIVLLKELPEPLKENIDAYIGCISGAAIKAEYLKKIESAGFKDVKVIDETVFPIEFLTNDPNITKVIENLGDLAGKIEEISNSVVSIKVQAFKLDSSC